MDHGLNGHCLKELCPGDRRPPTRIKNPPGGLPSYKSHDTGAGFSKKPRWRVAKRAHLETWDLSRKCEGCLKPAGR
ncbi:conserved hypothetical protein [Ricinus communis]|uniref:Uncharacterized protein n=1 Tax=Ricinus communis TaxID=3988 RepID=B9TBE8_RICCO|nr:conserved hypothetical protein [Ricinus communis]